jgi:hypothetical protein
MQPYMKSTTLGMAGLVSVLSLLFTSCQKEISSEDNGGNPVTNCRLSKITYYNSSGAVDDTAGIYYANDKITQVQTSTYYLNFTYSNDRVRRIDYFDTDNTPIGLFDSITYNNSGKIESLISYSTNTGADVPAGGYAISYNGDGTQAKVTEKTYSTVNGMEDTYEYAYTWSQQNITTMVVTELATSIKDTLAYTSDNNTNFINQFPAEFIFADNLMFGISGIQFGLLSPFVFNKNNIASVQGAPVTHEKDGAGNITALLYGGVKQASYAYVCQ